MSGVLDGNGPQIINTTILLGKIFIFKAQSRTNMNQSSDAEDNKATVKHVCLI